MEEKIKEVEKFIERCKRNADEAQEKMKKPIEDKFRMVDLSLMFNFWDGQRRGAERVLEILGYK